MVPDVIRAPEGTRTLDLLITNQLLYQLSHGSEQTYYIQITVKFQVLF